MAGRGITEIADYYAQIIGTLPAKPIVIGHSFGGLLAQNVLGRGLAAAAIAIDAAPIKGVLPLPVSTLRSSFPVLKNPANRKRTDRKSTRLNSSHRCSSYAVFCLKKK